MAGRKKQPELTAEEKLQQALVPETEQPYKVPDNWCWTRLGKVIFLISGRDAKLSDCNNEGNGIPYILGASNIEDNNFIIERWIEVPQVVSLKYDVLISVKGTIGKIYLQQEDEINISRQIMAIRPMQILNTNFVYWFMNYIIEDLRNLGNGLIPGISREDILTAKFPLPPLAEQQRIVERIETLFAKLDEAKEKLQNTLDTFETRKAVILHKAFTGELTATWRKQHGLTMDSWEEKTLGCTNIDIIDGDRGSNYPKKEEFALNGYCVFLNTKNVTNQGFNFERVEYITKEKDEMLRKGKLQRGDIVLTTRGTIGNIAFYDNNVPFDNMRINSGMVIYRNGKEFYKPFLVYLYKSRFITKQIEALQTGSAQPQLPIKIMKNIKLIIPPFDEQTEIVRIIDNLLAKEQQAHSIAQNALAQIDLIKKSILARAFRGQLATNNPADEPAIELLKKVL